MKEYPLGPPLDFLQRVWQLNHALEKLSSHMERTIGVTAQQRLIIRCVGKYPGITLGSLARVLHLDPGTVSTAIKRLTRKGLLERRRDPRDARRGFLGLTARGRELDRPTKGTVEGVVQRLLESTRPNETASAALVLDRLTTLLEAELASKPPPS